MGDSRMSPAPRQAGERNGPPPETAGGVVSRLLFVTGELRDESMGHSVLRLARELRRRGKDVDLVCGGGALVGEFERIGIAPFVARCLSGSRRPWLVPRGILAHVREFDPQLIHLFGRDLARWGRRLSRATGRPYVLAVMSFGAAARGRQVVGDWTRGSVVAPSEELREGLVNQAHIPKEAIGVVPVGIALEDYERYRGTDGEATVPVVGTVGPLEPDRGCEYFVEAARQIIDGGHEAQFLIAGDGPEYPALRRLIRKLKLDEWVTLVPQFSDYRGMIAVLDVCVVPAVQEGLGLDVVEAMACRKPVVATGAGPACSAVRDGETGFLAPKKDPAALAGKVIQLLEDRELARGIVDKAYEMVRERFSVEASVRRLLEFYAKCIARQEGA